MGSGGSHGCEAAPGRGRHGGGGYLLDPGAGHVTGRARDGRRPSSARPERPARPPPWGAAIAARTRTRTRCGRRGRGSGMRAEILGHGAQRKACRRGSPGLQGLLSTEARRGQITEETPAGLLFLLKPAFFLHTPPTLRCAGSRLSRSLLPLPLLSDVYNLKGPQPPSLGKTPFPASCAFSMLVLMGFVNPL